MQHYYRAAKVITQMNTAVLLEHRAAAALRRAPKHGVAIDATFVARGELLDIEDEAALERDPNGDPAGLPPEGAAPASSRECPRA